VERRTAWCGDDSEDEGRFRFEKNCPIIPYLQGDDVRINICGFYTGHARATSGIRKTVKRR
jgi:hypothetical protein